MSHCFNELSLLGNLQIIDIKELDFGYDRTRIDAFIEAISQLESLQRLKMQAEPWREGFPSLRHVKEIEVVSGDLKTWGEYPFSRKIVKFVTPMRTFPYAGPNFPKNYSSLKELSLGEFWSSLEDLCIALAAAPNLTHLKFKFSTDRRFVCVLILLLRDVVSQLLVLSACVEQQSSTRMSTNGSLQAIALDDHTPRRTSFHGRQWSLLAGTVNRGTIPLTQFGNLLVQSSPSDNTLREVAPTRVYDAWTDFGTT
ncbi:hypothetical protein FRC17_001646 [Serendipita sp. 399]|nr:hypothetical protein FRC17_001646 [Serendipita sp. 399]